MNKTQILRHPISLMLLFSIIFTACGTSPEAPAVTDPEIRETPTDEPALERVESVPTAELTILATSDPLDYPEPEPTPEISYPIVTATPYYAYADPENQSSSSDRDNIANANVTFVRAVSEGNNLWTFHVTVAHPDTGEEDYANGWDVITPENEVLTANGDDTFTRLLTHPHIDEQPFTRSQSGILVPESVTGVFVRAHDIVHGWGGEMVFVDFSQDEGPNYVIER